MRCRTYNVGFVMVKEADVPLSCYLQAGMEQVVLHFSLLNFTQIHQDFMQLFMCPKESKGLRNEAQASLVK